MDTETKLYLRVVYDTRDQEILKHLSHNGIYIEFNTEEFKERLIENSKFPQDMKHAFDLTCAELKKQILTM